MGDIITTEKDVHARSKSRLHGVPKFQAQPGALKGHKAIAIDEPLGPAAPRRERPPWHAGLCHRSASGVAARPARGMDAARRRPYNLSILRAARACASIPDIAAEASGVIEKVVIIGSGPAGWSAAIYAARAELQPLVFEGAITEENRIAGTLPLGQLNLTTEVENYAGFPAGNLEAYLDTRDRDRGAATMMAPHSKHGVSGPELMELMRQQAMNFGTRIVTDDIVKVDFSRASVHARPPRAAKRRRGADRDRRHRRPGQLPGAALGRRVQEPRRQRLRRLRRCAAAIPQQAAGRGRRRRFGRRRSDVPDASSPAASTWSIAATSCGPRRSWPSGPRPIRRSSWSGTSALDEVLGTDSDGVTGVALEQHRRRQAARSCDATGMFLAIGHTPNTAFLDGQLELTDKKYIKWTDAVPHQHQRRGRVRRRRRGRRLLSPGDHLGRHRLHGGARRRTLAGRAASSDAATLPSAP